jgi:hypothetical protein
MDINLWAVLVAGLANFVIGFMMHGPIAGKLWMKLANITPTGNEKFSDMYSQMFWNLVANLVFAFVLGSMMSWMGAVGAFKGAVFGFWVWLGYIVTSSSMGVIWMNQSYKLWMFELLSSLLSILAMGAILGAW